MRALALVCLLCAAPAAQDPGPIRAPRLSVLDVRELVEPLARRLGGTPADTPLVRRLDELVRLYAPDASSLPGDAIALDARGTSLIARVDAERAEWLARFVARQTEGTPRTIHVEASVFRLAARDAERLGLSTSARILRDPSDVARTLARLAEIDPTKQVTLPAIDTLPLASARTSRTTPLPYVREWRAYTRVEPAGAPLVDPVVETIEEGALLDTRIALLEGADVGLELELCWRTVARPIPIEKRDVGGQTREIARPQVDEVKVSAALVAPIGSAAVLALPESKQLVSVLVVRLGAPR